MVFEDFHFADPGLVDFVDHLLDWSRNTPITVVTLARPEFIERRPNWGAGKRNFTSTYLEPLSEPAMRGLLAGLVPGLPQRAIGAIVGRADGIPLYAIETVRMLLANGSLVLEGGAYRPLGDLTSLAVPETLTALVASRLDTLPAGDRTLISDAAVLGQSFTLAGLAVVSGIDQAALEPRLRHLVRRELLTLEANERSPEHGQYAFVQALIREVAYNTLAKPDRTRRHMAAARYFEGLKTDEIAGGLAGHYLAAYRNSHEGPEAEGIGAQARTALGAAAERAVTLGSHEQALAFLEQALTFTSDAAATANLLERAGEAASNAGRFDAARTQLQKAITALRELGDRSATAGATAALGRVLLVAGHSAEAIALLSPAAEEFADLATDPAVIALGGQLARAYFLHDDNRRSIEVADRVLEAAEHADLRTVVADTLVTKGTALVMLGRAIEGLGAIAAGHDLAQGMGILATVLRADTNRAVAEAARDPRAALEITQAGLVLARRLGLRGRVARFVGNLGDFALRTGDWPSALAELTAALAEDYEGSDRAQLLGSTSAIRALRGEPVADALDEIRRLLGDGGDPQSRAIAAVVAAFAAFAMDDLGEARTSWHLACSLSVAEPPFSLPRAARAALWAGDDAAANDDLAALEGSGFHGPAVEADRTTIRAGIAALEHRSADALALYREALRAWRDLGLAWDAALCGLDMAALLDPSEPEVQTAADAAREILVRLGARPFIERLDNTQRRPGRHEATSRPSVPTVATP